MAVTYWAEVGEDNVEAEGEVIRLLTLTGQDQADNYHLWKGKLFCVGRVILEHPKAGVSAWSREAKIVGDFLKLIFWRAL